MKIGLEVHMYPLTDSKMFCSCKASLEDAPNTNICPICTGQPGSKPMGINKKAFEVCLMLCKALKCEIIQGKKIFMQRKHYFYPDLPNNYQRTSQPIGVKGKFKGVRIREIHLEEDPGQFELKKGEVDFNRSGFPLIEIVTEPDMHTADEAQAFLEALKEVIDYLGVGRETFKADVNVSTNAERVEVKNVNSIENVGRVISYETDRQAREKAILETRHFDAMTGRTISLRVKESVADYRYLPDPDVPPLFIEEVDVEMPEDLFVLRERLEKEYGLSKEQVLALNTQGIVALFEKLAHIDPQLVANWLKKDLKGELNYRKIVLSDIELDTKEIEKLLTGIKSNSLTQLKARDLLREYLDGSKVVEIKKSDWDLEKIVQEVIEENAEVVEKYKKGKKSALHYLIGQVSKKTNKEIPAETIKKALIEKI